MNESTYLFAGKTIVWTLGAVLTAGLLAALVWSAGVFYIWLVNLALSWRGYFGILKQLKQTHRPFAKWAARLCRENDTTAGDSFGTSVDLHALREFFKGYDPDNTWRWQ